MTPDCRCRYLCERCGGSGKQEEGNYSYATNSYTGKAGKCQICDGTGYLGYINQQQAARLANLPGLPKGWSGPWSGCPDGNLWGYRAGRLCDFALDCGFNNAQFLATLLNACYPPAPGQQIT